VTAIAEADVWTAAEREAWALDGEVLPSDWQDRHRILTARMGAAEPGRMRTDRLPYTRGILDAWVKPWLTDITVLTATQLGKTEMIITLLGYIADQRPGNVLFVEPRKDDAKGLIRDRITPAFRECEAVARHFTGVSDDIAQHRLAFDRMMIHAGWAESEASLASRPLPYYFGDELSEWAQDRDELCIQRTRTHWNRKHFRTSTPKLDIDPIVLKWEQSLQFHYYVPCPHCLGYQVLVFTQIKWPADERDPNRIETRNLAWYECEHCGGTIREGHKRGMLLGGIWIPDVEATRFLKLYGEQLRAALRSDRRGELLGGRTADDVAERLDPDGDIGWEMPESSHWGFQLAGWYAPWDSRRFSVVAKEFLEAKDFPAKLQVFRNKTQALPWTETAETVEEEALDRLIVRVPRGVVPADVQVLTAGADVHGDRTPTYAVILGWAADDRCHLVWEGQVGSFDELGELLFGRGWRVQGGRRVLWVRMAFVDARYRRDEVYRFARRWSDVCRPVMGMDSDRQAAKWVVRHVDRLPVSDRPNRAGLRRVDIASDAYRREVLRHVAAGKGAPGSISFHEEVSVEYRQHLASVRLLRVTDRKTGAQKYEWRGTTPAHHFACTVYAFAAAEYVRARHLPPLGDGEVPGRPRRKVRMSEKLGYSRRPR